MVKGRLKGMDPTDQLSFGEFCTYGKPDEKGVRKLNSKPAYLVGRLVESWACPDCMNIVIVRDMVNN